MKKMSRVLSVFLALIIVMSSVVSVDAAVLDMSSFEPTSKVKATEHAHSNWLNDELSSVASSLGDLNAAKVETFNFAEIGKNISTALKTATKKLNALSDLGGLFNGLTSRLNSINLAAEPIEITEESDSAESLVTYGVSSTYTVTFPRYILATKPGAEYNKYIVSANDVVIPVHTELGVSIDRNEKMVHHDNSDIELEYSLFKEKTGGNDTLISSNKQRVFKVPAGNQDEVTATIYAVTDDDIRYAGLYEEQVVTFSLKVTDHTYTDEEIESSEDAELFIKIGKTVPENVLALFNEDYTEVSVFANGEETDGLMMDWTEADETNPFYVHKDTLKSVNFTGVYTPLRSIGNNAFNGCTNLEGTLVVSNTVESIGENAFKGCTGLTGIRFADGTFVIDEAELPVLSAPATAETETTGENKAEVKTAETQTVKGKVLNSGSEEIEPEIEDEDNLVSEDLPTNSGCVIGASAFENCTGVENIYFGNTIVEIGNSAFKGCTALTSIKTGVNTKVIKDRAFENCISVGNVVEFPGAEKVGTNVFDGDEAVDTLRIGGTNITELYSLPYDCTLEILGTTKTLGYAMFLKNHTWNAIVPVLGERVKHLVLNEGLETIESLALSQLYSIEDEELIIPDTVKTIGQEAFIVYGSSSGINSEDVMLKVPFEEFGATSEMTDSEIREKYSMWLDEDDRRILLYSGVYALDRENEWMYDYDGVICPKWKRLILGDSVETIGASAFYNLGFEEVVFNDALKVIGRSAFAHCYFLGNLKFGNSLERIEELAFSGCCGGRPTYYSSNADYYSDDIKYGGTENIVFPDSLQYIGESAFAGYERYFDGKTKYHAYLYPLSGTVTFGNSLVKVDEYAFSGSGITGKITFPDTCEIIGGRAFRETGIEEIEFSDNISYIGASAFSYCEDLVSINKLPENLTEITTSCFENDKNLTSNIIIPDSVETIRNSSFKNTGISGLKLGNSVKIIEGSAFSYCSNLQTLIFNDVLEEIWSSAFYECTSLEVDINLPQSLKYFGAMAFANSGITGVSFGTGIEDWGLPPTQSSSYSEPKYSSYINSRFGGGQFADCKNIVGTVDFPAEYKIVPYNLFRGCYGLEKVILHEGLEGIGASAFQGCCSLTGTLVIPDSVTQLGPMCFDGFYGTSTGMSYSGLVLGDGITSIPTRAFACWPYLEELRIDYPQMDLYSNAFYGCSGIKELTLGIENITSYVTDSLYCRGYANDWHITFLDTVKTIGNYAFEFCKNLSGELFIPASVTSIGRETFSGWTTQYTYAGDIAVCRDCPKITSLVFEEGSPITEIPEKCFTGCSQLTGALVLPENIKKIGRFAFSGYERENVATYVIGYGFAEIFTNAPKFTSIVFNEGLEEICDYAFSGQISYGDTLEIPGSVKKIGTKAFYGDSSYAEGTDRPCPAKNIILHEGIETIGAYAFCNARNVTGVLTIPSTVTNIGNNAFQNVGTNGELTNIIVYGNVGASAFYGAKSDNLDLSNVTSTGDSAFAHATALRNPITLDLRNCTVIGDKSFFHNYLDDEASRYTDILLSENLVSIGAHAFANNRCIATETLVIPASCVSIGDYAFSEVDTFNFNKVTFEQAGDELSTSHSIKNLVINSEELTIGAYAFARNSLLENITINGVVTSIGDYAFYGCYNLEKVNFPEGLITIGNSAFRGNAILGKLVIPSTVETIGDYAFSSGSDYKELYITEIEFLGGKQIGTGAFYNCKNLEKITFSEGLIEIGNSAFLNCNKLDGTLIIPDSVQTIGRSAFEGCDSLDYLTIGSGVLYLGDRAFYTYYGEISDMPVNINTVGTDIFGPTVEDDDGAIYSGIYLVSFSNKKQLTSYTVKEGTKVISGNAFNADPWLTEVNLPDTIVSIGDSAFACCPYLTTVNGVENVVNVGASAFASTTNLENISMPILKTVGAKAFYGCKKIVLEDVFGPTVETVGDQAYYDILGGNTLHFGENFKSIGDYAFRWYGTGTRQVNEVIIDSQIVPARMYPGVSSDVMSSNVTLTINEGVKEIADDCNLGGVFYNSCNLTVSPMPSTLERIGNYGWAGTNPAEIIFSEGLEEIGDYAFKYYGANVVVTMPSTLKSIGEYAFQQSKITGVELNDGLKTIGKNAFYYCEKLAGTIYIASSVESIGDEAFAGYMYSKTKYYRPLYDTVIIKPENLELGNYIFRYHSTIEECTLGITDITQALIDTNLCLSVRHLTLLDGVETIGDNAFCNNSSLSGDIIFPDSVVSIGAGAFCARSYSTYNGYFPDGRSFDSITFGSGIKSIGNGAFDYVNIREGIYFDENCSDVIIGETAFREYYGRTVDAIDFEVHGIKNYGRSAFEDRVVKEFTLNLDDELVLYRGCLPSPISLTVVGDVNNSTYAEEAHYYSNDSIFADLSSVQELVLGVKNLDYNFFENYLQPDTSYSYALNTFSLTLLEGVETICTQIPEKSSYNFPGNHITNDLVIPSTCYYIGKYAFADKTIDGKVNLGTNENLIVDECAFADCDFSELNVGSARVLGDYAFERCDNLTKLNWGDNLEVIGYWCFYECPLTFENDTLVIPDTVIEVGPEAFWAKYFSYSLGDYVPAFTKVVLGSSLDMNSCGAVYRERWNYNTQQYEKYLERYTNIISLTDCVTSLTVNSDLSIDSILDNVSNVKNLTIGENCTHLYGIKDEYENEQWYYDRKSNFSNLEHIDVAADNPTYMSSTGIMYNEAQTEFLWVPAKLHEYVIVPQGIVSIGDNMFRGTRITGLELCDTLENIGQYAFADCAELAGEVVFPDSITFIGDYAFYNNALLESVVLGSGAPVSAYCFANCLSLVSADLSKVTGFINRTNNYYWLEENPIYSFTNDSALKHVALGETLTTIPYGCFANCTGLENIDLSKITHVQTEAFQNCSSLSDIGNVSFTRVNNYGFADCANLTSDISFDGERFHELNGYYTSSSVGMYAFCNTSINSVDLDSVYTLGEGAFQNCSSLTGVIDLSGVRSIGSSVFVDENHTSSVDEIHIGMNTPVLPENCFLGTSCNAASITCDVGNTTYKAENNVLYTKNGKQIVFGCKGSPKNFTVPTGVSQINAFAFAFVPVVEEIILNPGVSFINDYAFYMMPDLKNVVFVEGLLKICDYAFAYCPELTVNVQLPDSLLYIGVSAFEDDSKIQWIGVPATTQYAGENAFHGVNNATLDADNSYLSVIDNEIVGGNSDIKLPYIGEEVVTDVVWSLNEDNTVLTISGSGRMKSFGNMEDGYERPWDDYIDSIEEIIIEDGVTNIGGFFATAEMTDTLKKITIGKDVEDIGDAALAGNMTLTDIVISNNNTHLVCEDGIIYNSDKTVLYYGLGASGEVEVPEGVTTMSGFAFAYNQNITGIKLPSTLETLPEGAFGYCVALKTVDLGGVINVMPMAMAMCPSIEELIIDANLTTVFEESFYGCNQGAEVGLPTAKCKLIVTGEGAMKGDPNVLFEEDFASAPWLMVSMNVNLTEVEIGDGVTAIGGGSFVNYSMMSGLKKITIGKNVSVIDPFVFTLQTGLNEFIISEENTSISYENGVIYSNGVLSDILSSYSGIINIKPGTTEIPMYCGYMSKAKAVIIPDTVTTIGEGAFSGMLKVERMEIPLSVVNVASEEDEGEVYYMAVEGNNPSMIIYGEANSVAERIAESNGYEFAELCAHTHKEEVAAVAATCAEAGYTAGVYCNDCEKWLSGHDTVTVPHTDTDSDGMCDECGSTMSDIPLNTPTVFFDDGNELALEMGDLEGAYIWIKLIPAKSGTYSLSINDITYNNEEDIQCIVLHTDYEINDLLTDETELMNAMMAQEDDYGPLKVNLQLEAGERYLVAVGYDRSHKQGEIEVTWKYTSCAHENTVVREEGTAPVDCGNPGQYGIVFCEDCNATIHNHEAWTLPHTDANSDGSCDDCGASLSDFPMNEICTKSWTFPEESEIAREIDVYEWFRIIPTVSGTYKIQAENDNGNYCSIMAISVTPDELWSMFESGDEEAMLEKLVGQGENEATMNLTANQIYYIGVYPEADCGAEVEYQFLYTFPGCPHNNVDVRTEGTAPVNCGTPGVWGDVWCCDCNDWAHHSGDEWTIPHTDTDGNGVCDNCSSTLSDIVPGQTVNVYVEGKNTQYLMFIPSQSGYYTLEATATHDTYGYLMNADMEQIDYNDDGGNNYNFKLRAYLEAGTKYYWGCRFYSSDYNDTIPVTLTFNG